MSAAYTAPAFVILSADGRFWDGAEWSGEMGRARRFSDGPDAWADAHLAVSCLRGLGQPCSVAAIPIGAVRSAA